jgi:hypothetical protein
MITGIGEVAAGLYALWPQWPVETVRKIPFVPDYTIISQHWGILVGLMGGFMIFTAFKVEWREPILIHSYLKKRSWLIWLWQSETTLAHRVSRPMQRCMRQCFCTRSFISEDSVLHTSSRVTQ